MARSISRLWKSCAILWLGSLSLLPGAIPPVGVLHAHAETPATASSSLAELSERLAKLQTALAEKYGIHKIYIGGGSSRAILDHLRDGRPISMRDLDVMVEAGRKVDKAWAESLGKELEKAGVGRFLPKELRPRPRGNPKLSPEESRAYNAGFGFFMSGQDDVVLDLSIYHSSEDLGLNGIFDVDTTLIPLENGTTLSRLEPKLRAALASPAMEALPEVIVDPHGGYRNWVRGDAKIVHPAAIATDPTTHSIRVVRTVMKLGRHELPADMAQKLRSLNAEAGASKDPFQTLRNLLKLFDDGDWVTGLRMLNQAGAIETFSPSLAKAIAAPEFGARSRPGRLAFEPQDITRNTQRSIDRFLAVAELIPAEQRIPLLKLLHGVEPKLGPKVIFQSLSQLGRPARIAYFTGAFDPFHQGHQSVVETASREANADLVLVIPTPNVAEDPALGGFVPAEYHARVRSAEIAVADMPRALVLDYPTPTEKTKTSDILGSLKQAFPKGTAEWTHVMGTDSFDRYAARGLDKKSADKVLVVGRPTYSNVKPREFGQDVRFVPAPKGDNISSTLIFQRIIAGASPESLGHEANPQALSYFFSQPGNMALVSEIRGIHRDFLATAAKKRLFNLPASGAAAIVVSRNTITTRQEIENYRAILRDQRFDELSIVLKEEPAGHYAQDASGYARGTRMTLEEREREIRRELESILGAKRLRFTRRLADAGQSVPVSRRVLVLDSKEYIDAINYGTIGELAEFGKLQLIDNQHYRGSPLVPETMPRLKVHAVPEAEQRGLQVLAARAAPAELAKYVPDAVARLLRDKSTPAPALGISILETASSWMAAGIPQGAGHMLPAGLEVEFGGLTAAQTAKILLKHPGAMLVKPDASSLGRATEIELVHPEVGTVRIKTEDNDIGPGPRGPPLTELVTEPLAAEKARSLHAIVADLRAAGATGTGSGLAASIQVNVGVPGKTQQEQVDAVVNLLRSYYRPEHLAQINEALGVPENRKKFLNELSAGFKQRLLDPKYRPTPREFYDDALYRQSLEWLGEREAFTLPIETVKRRLLSGRSPVVPEVVKLTRLRVSSFLMGLFPDDPLSKAISREEWCSAGPYVEFRDLNNDFDVSRAYRRATGLMEGARALGYYDHDSLVSEHSTVSRETLARLRAADARRKPGDPLVFRYFLGDKDAIQDPFYQELLPFYEDAAVGFLPAGERGRVPLRLPDNSVVFHSRPFHDASVVGTRNPGLANGLIAQALENKYVESRFWQRYAPGAMPRTELLRDVARRAGKGPGAFDMGTLRQALDKKFPSGWVIKGNFDLGTEKAGLISSQDDLAKAIDEYRRSDFDSHRARILEVGTNESPDWVEDELKSHKGYKGWRITQILNDPSSAFAQESVPIAKEFRVEVINGKVLAASSTVDRYYYAETGYVRSKPEEFERVEAWAQEQVDRLPPELRSMPMGLDVAVLKDGGICLIESNPGGNSGFLASKGKSIKAVNARMRELAQASAQSRDAAAIGLDRVDQMRFLKGFFAKEGIDPDALYPRMRFLSDSIEDPEFPIREARPEKYRLGTTPPPAQAEAKASDDPLKRPEIFGEIDKAAGKGRKELLAWRDAVTLEARDYFARARVVETADPKYPLALVDGDRVIKRFSKKIGEGSNANVYLSENGTAVKVVKDAAFARKQLLQAWTYPALARHGIAGARVLDFEPNGIWLEQEHIDSPSLEQLYGREAQVPEAVRRQVFETWKQARSLAEREGIYLDLKAANFCVDRNGRLVNVDYAPRLTGAYDQYYRKADGRELTPVEFEYAFYRKDIEKGYSSAEAASPEARAMFAALMERRQPSCLGSVEGLLREGAQTAR